MHNIGTPVGVCEINRESMKKGYFRYFLLPPQPENNLQYFIVYAQNAPKVILLI